MDGGESSRCSVRLGDVEDRADDGMSVQRYAGLRLRSPCSGRHTRASGVLTLAVAGSRRCKQPCPQGCPPGRTCSGTRPPSNSSSSPLPGTNTPFLKRLCQATRPWMPSFPSSPPRTPGRTPSQMPGAAAPVRALTAAVVSMLAVPSALCAVPGSMRACTRTPCRTSAAQPAMTHFLAATPAHTLTHRWASVPGVPGHAHVQALCCGSCEQTQQSSWWSKDAVPR